MVGKTLEAMAILSDTTWSHTVNQKRHVSLGDQQTYYLKFFKDFANLRSSLSAFSQKFRPQMRPCNNQENKISLGTYWKVQLVCMKVQTYSSLKPPLEHNQDQVPFSKQGWFWSF